MEPINFADGAGEKETREKEKDTSECVTVNELTFVDKLDNDIAECNNGEASAGAPRKRESPPFLLKTFTMVDDAETDSIISWGLTRTSFIIWDTSIFSAQVLPKYFKQPNFSSFVCQLNNYGFKKIHWSRCEYANKWFQGGNEHLLKNIKRRKQLLATHQQDGTKSRSDLAKCEHEVNLESLRNDQNLLKIEIENLKQRQEHMKDDINTLRMHMQTNAGKQEKLAMFMDKADDPTFFEQLIEQLMQGREFKKRRLEAMDAEDTPRSGVHDNDEGIQEIGEKTSGSGDEASGFTFWKRLLEDNWS